MYCAPSDILSVVDQVKLKTLLGLVDDGGNLEETDALEDTLSPYITSATQYIDSILGSRYVIPITDSQSLAMLISPACSLTMAAVYSRFQDISVSDGVKDETKKAEDLIDAYAHRGDRTRWLNLPATLLLKPGFPKTDPDVALKSRIGIVPDPQPPWDSARR